MNLSTINNTQTNFQSNNRKIYDKEGNLKYKTTTFFFRPDLDWNKFCELLDEKYKQKDKVNIINHACSDGHETYSLASILLDKFGKNSSKFFPIKAFDIDNYNIAKAKSLSLELTNSDYDRIFDNIQNLTDYFKTQKTQYGIYDLSIKPKKNLKNNIIFKTGDIFEDIKTIPRKNTVLLCRNFWHYLTNKDAERLSKMMYKRLKSSSLLVVGNFDSWEKHYIAKAGFVETSVENVFKKPKYPILFQLIKKIKKYF